MPALCSRRLLLGHRRAASQQLATYPIREHRVAQAEIGQKVLPQCGVRAQVDASAKQVVRNLDALAPRPFARFTPRPVRRDDILTPAVPLGIPTPYPRLSLYC